MRFGPVPLAEAEGAVLAHSVDTGAGRLRKGLVLGTSQIARLREAGLSEVVAARLDPGEVGENAAAGRLADALVSGGVEARAPFTGRANLHATGPGILRIDCAAIDAVNRIDPAITLATLPEWQRVARGTMVATVKIIAYGVPDTALDAASAAAAGALGLVPPAIDAARLIVTTLPGAPNKHGAVTDRLDRLDIACRVREVAHEEGELTDALAADPAPLTLILTASATSDENDVAPAALVRAGGRLERFGMPVDPGNLLFLGDLCGAPVIGLPGCVRSPALNGADWVLERIICGLPVTGDDIAAMGVGGLLGEIPTRPQPRERR